MAKLQHVLRALATRFDRVFTAVGEEYRSEERSRPADTSGQRRIKNVERLLAGELLSTDDLAYHFDGWHLGVVASGLRAGQRLNELAGILDRYLLAIERGEGGIWAWFGGRHHFEQPELDAFVSFSVSGQTAIACGNPGHGLNGWRLTHRQASLAFGVAQYGAESPVRYGDVALLATVIQDDVLTAFLHQRYLVPLESGRDGGVSARQTLHAYFAAGGNISSAAAALGISRNTVASRLLTIEAKLGRPLDSCRTDLEAALHIDRLTGFSGYPNRVVSKPVN
jgi:DNA-binding CsgD family transcriptional regulator